MSHNERIHKCGTCQGAFKSKASLTQHIKMVHEKIRPYICEFCNKAYPTKVNLVRHQVNGGCKENKSLKDQTAKNFKCEVCEKSFFSNTELRNHCKIHQEYPILYQCDNCVKSYSSKQYLSRHIRSVP